MFKRWYAILSVLFAVVPSFAQKQAIGSQPLIASKFVSVKNFEFLPSQGYLKTPEGPAREFTLVLDTTLFCGGKLTVESGGKSRSINIAPSPEGIDRITETFPVGYMEEQANAKITLTSSQGTVSQTISVPAARRWTLYFLPHSHLDIGYTHRQKEVMELQWRNLERAIDLSDRTKNYPVGARYKWNAEATWPVNGYLEKYQGTAKAEALIEAIRCGDIGMDATLGSILTGVCKQEELMHLFDDAHKIATLTGTQINTAMMSDVPGQSWGTVTAMAQNGVRYFSSGPNYVPSYGRLGSFGVGLYNLKWGDLPCWWQSQSGEEKILYWQTGKGYSMFHGWLMDKLSVCGTEPVWDYLSELEQKEYPYDLTYLRYTIHGDNGPPDELMPDVIREWNAKYDYPHFVIGTTKELFTQMEKQYGDYLPTYSGDMTPIWEDGAASSARELSMNRESSERLNQSEIIWSILRPVSEFPASDFAQGWKYAILFSEHTWGAAGSGPEPESQFTIDLWAGKKLYADSAEIVSKQLYDSALETLRSDKPQFVHVLNTNLWVRSDVVAVEGVDLTNKILLSSDGEYVPVQKLSDGRWVFYAKNLAPLSSTPYSIVEDSKKMPTSPAMVQDNVLNNDLVRVVIDKTTGAISSFKVSGEDYEFVAKEGLNSYLYSGRNGKDPKGVESLRSITVIDNGSVAATIRVVSDAPGAKQLTRDVTIYRNSPRVDISNTVDKLNVYEHENIRFSFPFNIDNPEVAMDLAMGEMHPEREQLMSANKNFYSVLNGVSVSNLKMGIYLTTIDAPFVEMGEMTADLSRSKGDALGWLNAATVSPTIYSWVMNNRWRTNYKASQEGLTTFRYSIQTFNPNEPALKKQGAEQAQKLIAIPCSSAQGKESLFRVKGKNQIAISTIRPSADGQGYIVRLQNMGPLTTHSAIEWGSLKATQVWKCDNMENTTAKLDPTSLWLKPYDCITMKVGSKNRIK